MDKTTLDIMGWTLIIGSICMDTFIISMVTKKSLLVSFITGLVMLSFTFPIIVGLLLIGS
jgi:hypothetical protein